MRNIKDIDNFLNEEENDEIEFTPLEFTPADILTGENMWNVFGGYVDSLTDLNEREKAIVGDIWGQISEGRDGWIYDEDNGDSNYLDNLLSNIGDQVHDGAYTYEETDGEGWFEEDDYDNFLAEYVYVPGKEHPKKECYHLSPLEFIDFVIGKNPAFIAEFLGPDHIIPYIKNGLEKGIPLDYKKILSNLEKFHAGSSKSIYDIDPIRIDKLTKAYTLLRRK